LLLYEPMNCLWFIGFLVSGLSKLKIVLSPKSRSPPNNKPSKQKKFILILANSVDTIRYANSK